MADRLKNILHFIAIPAGNTVSLPHGLHVASRALIPDYLDPNPKGLTISADITNVSVTNTTNSPLDVDVLCEAWHTIERAFEGVQNEHLAPQPYISGPDIDLAGPTGATGPTGPTGPMGVTGATGTAPIGPPDAIAFFNALGALAGDNATWYLDLVTKNVFLGGNQGITELFINQIAVDHGSNAGFQQSSLVANRAQVRENQYGNNTGIPGITAFKSRDPVIGNSTAVQVGDVIFRASAIGVCGDNATIPLSGLISINVDQVLANFLGTSFEIQLVPPTGPVNGRKQAFRVDGNGILHLTEAVNKCSGIAVLDVTGTAVVNNIYVSATTKFHLTYQESGLVIPTGSPWQASRVIGTSFTIKATTGAADAGMNVYYTLFEPTVP